MVVYKSTLNDINKVGYGTAYERKLLNNLLKRLIKIYNISSILEYPANDLLGDHRVLYSGIDICIERINRNRARVAEFDLVWNFCEIENATNPYKLISEVIKLTAKNILLIGQNIFNLGVPLHRIFHSFLGPAWDHGDPKRMRLTYAIELTHSQGLAIVEHGYFDAPIFVLDLYECGSVLRKRFTNNSQYGDMLLKESPFEKMPRPFKPLFSHHWYLLCQQPNAKAQ